MPTKFCCVYSIAAESRTCLKSLTMASSKHLQVRIAELWHFLGLYPNMSQGDILCKETKRFFFIIRTKITSAHKCENIFFQSSDVAIVSDTSALTTKHYKEALEDLYYQCHTSVSVCSCIFLCHLLYFWADSSICKLIAVSRPVIVLGCQAETSDGLIFSNMRSYSDVLTASVGSGSAPPSCLPRLQSH